MNVPPVDPSTMPAESGTWPMLLTVPEAAHLLRTTTRGVCAMVERRQLPGVVRVRRRVLFRTAVLLDWVDQKSAPLPKE